MVSKTSNSLWSVAKVFEQISMIFSYWSCIPSLHGYIHPDTLEKIFIKQNKEIYFLRQSNTMAQDKNGKWIGLEALTKQINDVNL